MEILNYYLGIHPIGALAIVLSTVLLYFSFALLLRWYGQRMYASPSSLDLAVVTVLGAIVGRAILGRVPTLAGGLLALAVLFGLEAIVGRVRRTEAVRTRGRHRAVAVMVDGRIDRTEMHRHHLDDNVLWSALRGAGVRNPADAALVVLEQNGRFSVLRAGEPIHPAALTGVRHANELRARLDGKS
ncbi:MAG: DUF421 domain-containing protein [Candidatus Nanopelagicales bacterium]